MGAKYTKQAEETFGRIINNDNEIIYFFDILKCTKRIPMTLFDAEEYNLYRWRRKRNIRHRYSKACVDYLAPGVTILSITPLHI